MYARFFSFLVALCVYAHWAVASMTSGEIANSLNEMALQGFAAKDLVLEINSTSDAGPMRDVYTEINTIVTEVLTNVEFMTNTPTITDETEEQAVYEGYSNFVQSLFELMDAFSSSAAQLMSIDQATKYEVPSEVRILESAVDAYFFNIIGLFPANGSYNAQASNQKAEVDTHCYQAIWAFDLYGSSSVSNTSLHARRMMREAA
ncbi:hypothetical protein BO70DRAFT_361683 [Aspergillus heteromorphus CBS 117.55]|uniref:Uncharacterized protein n=1 Tax=Aspergillus heteromorphus CBS 117.55 TaxID=1448321 RepID=A0A317WEB2_9EURO|nr:uncharacterized protein BO70DRAFT_361683 [Aspergillus heteromorphus CBS 117.55]PWY83587.1 hypothetical protein BO70DRAFT_361683 [Aspergillus heteromorphus CBS 117.55]